MEGGSVVLLNCFVSPFGNRVRIALKHKGVAYKEIEENLADKSALLLSSNPVHAKIPVLIVGDKPAVCESLVILEFIEDAFSAAGKPPLLPADPYARAHARFWASYADTKLSDAGRRVWQSPNKGAAEEAKKDMVAALKTLEAELGAKPYFGGDALGYVDVVLVPFAPWFLTYERFGGLSVAAECPALAAWAERCARENACVAESLPEPEQVFQFMCGMRKAFGID